MWIALKRRKGTGKAYLIAPKKKPVISLQLIENRQAEETFKPVVNKANPRGEHTESIGEILISAGEKTKQTILSGKFDSIRGFRLSYSARGENENRKSRTHISA